MARISGGLWVALAGAVLVVVSLGTNFYVYDGETRDAWFGLAHASEFLLATALVTVVLTGLAAAGRSLVRGRSLGVIVGALGTVAALHVGYRMAAPPFDFGQLPDRVTILDLFGSCLGYCNPADAGDVELLPGIFIALAGAALVAVGGWAHRLSSRASTIAPNFFRAPEQPGMSPWLGLAGLGAVGQFLFGFTVFTFYLVPMDDGGQRAWSGWFPMPHTSVMVLWSTVLVIGLVGAAARRRAPMGSQAIGGVVALLGLLALSRILYRMVEAPFGGGSVPANLGLGAFLALASALLVVVAGTVHALTQRRSSENLAGATEGPPPHPA